MTYQTSPRTKFDIAAALARIAADLQRTKPGNPIGAYAEDCAQRWADKARAQQQGQRSEAPEQLGLAPIERGAGEREEGTV